MIRSILFIVLMLSVSTLSHGQSKSTKRKGQDLPADTIDGVYIPKDVDDCVKQLDIMLTKAEKSEIAEMTAPEFLENAQFELGLWIRNNWKLWYGSRLYKNLLKKGCKHADAMSEFILKKYYEHLTTNNEE